MPEGRDVDEYMEPGVQRCAHGGQRAFLIRGWCFEHAVYTRLPTSDYYKSRWGSVEIISH
jgi:hypothetical protein